jgi:biotin carboxyl carrier protein
MRNFKITVDGRQYDVTVEEIAAVPEKPAIVPLAKQEEIKSASVKAAASAPVKTAAAPVKAASTAAAGTKINSPMPGMVLNLKVAEGSRVTKGQVVLILEAMKMENDISAPADGIISFTVSKGATVETGTCLAVIS